MNGERVVAMLLVIMAKVLVSPSCCVCSTLEQSVLKLTEWELHMEMQRTQTSGNSPRSEEN